MWSAVTEDSFYCKDHFISEGVTDDSAFEIAFHNVQESRQQIDR